MARKRIIYQSEALYAGKTGDGTPGQLHRVQDVSHSIEVARQDINEFGKLAALSREVIEPPTVGLDFTYYVIDGFNEASGLGLTVQGINSSTETSAVSGIMAQNSTDAEKNFYILTVPEGDNASDGGSFYTAGESANHGAIGIGNGFVTSYTLDASVGDIMSGAVGGSGANVQSFSIDLPLARTPLQRIGNVFPFSRELDFPIAVTMSVTANLTELSPGALRDLLCAEARKRDIAITMKNRCDGGKSLQYIMKGAILDSQT